MPPHRAQSTACHRQSPELGQTFPPWAQPGPGTGYKPSTPCWCSRLRGRLLPGTRCLWQGEWGRSSFPGRRGEDAPGHASTTQQGDPSPHQSGLRCTRRAGLHLGPGSRAAVRLFPHGHSLDRSHAELGTQEPQGTGRKGVGGTTRPTFAFALVHHFEVGVVSALGRQQVALVSVGVAVGAADLQLAGQAGAVGGTGALGTPVLHLADLVGAAHHPLAALWGQRGAAHEDTAPAARHEGRIHPAQPGWHPGPTAAQGGTDQDRASISPRGPESLPESQHARLMPSCPEQHLDLLSSAKEQVLGWSSARSSSTHPSQSPGPPLSTS